MVTFHNHADKIKESIIKSCSLQFFNIEEMSNGFRVGKLGEHEISVGNHDAKRSGFQLIVFFFYVQS